MQAVKLTEAQRCSNIVAQCVLRLLLLMLLDSSHPPPFYSDLREQPEACLASSP